MDLNTAETFLSQRKFDFKEIKDSDENKNYYAFSYNLDKFGEKGDKYLIIAIDVNNERVIYVWYQLKKEGWINLKNSLNGLGYKKIKIEAESDGSLTTEYKNSEFKFSFNAGKSLNDYNESVFIYSLSVR